MLNSSKFNDLCVSCNYASLCTIRLTLMRPILFCEKYDIKLNLKNNSLDNSKMEPSYSNNRGESVIQLKGICNNCANRETCMHSKPEEGIWHCEEYV